MWGLVEREAIEFLLIVGDAFARPLLDELDRHDYELSSLNVVMSGGAVLSVGMKQELLAHLPTVMLVDGLGSSEAGGQLTHVSTGTATTTGSFAVRPGNHLLAADLTGCWRPVRTRSGGWPRAAVWRSATSATPPRPRAPTPSSMARYAVPGDRARWRDDGRIELHGRDAVTINSGGEKIFAEEVEMAIKAHPGVYDCVVAGRPSAHWGSEVVAIVRTRDGIDVTAAGLLDVAARHIARYKLPKGIVFVDEIVRSPSGKADYRWARRRRRLLERAYRWAMGKRLIAVIVTAGARGLRRRRSRWRG